MSKKSVLYLKKLIAFFISITILFGMFGYLSPVKVFADQTRVSNFSKNYTLTGDGATDMINIAKAQIGKTGSSLGYSQAWCANFVADCAELAGQSSAIPKRAEYANVDKLSKYIGGKRYYNISEIKPGDIVFYDGDDHNGSPNHVEIVVYVSGGLIYSIGGNTSYAGSVYTSVVSKVRVYYNNNNSKYFLYTLRPNYKGNPNPVPPTPDPNVYPEPTRNLYVTSPYMTGDDVKWVQDMLCKLGYSTTIDGIYGNGTKNKVIEFQKANGLTADGIVGAGTRSKLKEVYNSLYSGHIMHESEAAGRTIPDGDYYIGSEINQDYFVDIPGNDFNTANGKNVQMWTWGSSMPPKEGYDCFHVEYLNNGFYKIKQINTNMCLDSEGNSIIKSANVQMWTDAGNNAQQWSIEKTSHGYRLRARCSGFYLDVVDGKHEAGTNLRCWEGNNSKAQSFSFIPRNLNEYPISDGNYTIKTNVNKSSLLDVSGVPGQFTSGSNVQIWNGGGDSYTIKNAGDGWYKIYEKTSGLIVEVACSNSDFLNNAKNVQLANDNGGKNQLWKLRKNSDGTYFIINKDSGYYLDLCDSKTDSGTNVFQHQYNGNNNQRWIIETESYTISYNMNGGNGTIANQTKIYGQDLTLSSTIPTRKGYIFAGWSTSSTATTAQYQTGSKYTANSGATLYAVWNAKQITVTFYRNLNSSDNATATQTFTYGVGGQSFSNKGWTKEGYTLIGWSFDINATTESYSTLSGVSNDWINDYSPSKNVYAVWKRNDENLGTYEYANPGKTTLYAMISYGDTNKYLTNQSDDYKNDKSYKNVDLRSKNDSLQQVWEFERLSDGGYKISSVYDGRILDIFNTKTDNGTNIGACGTYYANGGQIWYLVKKDGKYVIQPKVSSNVYLGAANSNDGSNIQVTITSNLFNIEILKPVGKSTLNVVQEGTSETPTKFTWTTATDATWYNLYIYDGEVWKSNCIYSKENIKGLEWSAQLKPGTYQAHLSPLNIHNWTNSNFVSFTVKADNYTISYDLNGGTGSINSQTKIQGQELTISDIVPTRPDYLFIGWSTDKNATTAQYQPGSKYTNDSSVILYAVWKVNHSYTTKVIAPTCTEQGYTLHTCANCGDSYKDTYTAAVGHKYIESVIAPTESSQGYTLHTCSVCGDSYKDNYTDVLKPDDPNAPQIVVDNKTIGSGNEVIVSVSLKNNPGIMALKFNVSYDSNVMTLINAESVGINALYSQNITDNPFVVSWESGDHDIDTNGEIVKLTFMVNENANEGTYPITITYDEDNIYNLKEENIHFDVVNGSVTVSEYLPGDINNDGKVNMKDLTRLHQYINGWDVTVNESAKDVNGDGKVNMKDLTRLHQFINGWDVDIY